MALFQKDSTTARSLILAGGGVRLAYHAGVLKALEEEGLSFNHVDGTSGGIFGTAMMASGITPTEAGLRWRRLKLKGFMGILPFKSYHRHQALHLFNGAEGIKRAIFPALGIDINRINANTTFDATFNVCNFSKKAVESIPHHSVTTDHLVAGLSLPMFIPATKIGSDWYTDAVWIKDANLTGAVTKGAHEIWLIWCIGNTPEYHHGRFNEYVHMIEISANAGLLNELVWIKNENINRVNAGISEVVLHIIRPDYPLPLDPAFFFKKIDADTLINMGYADTSLYLKERKPVDLKQPSTNTVMESCDATLHFRQQFYGAIDVAGIKQPACFHFAYFIRKKNDHYVIQQYTSVELTDRNTAISGYDNVVTKTGKGAISASFYIRYENAVIKVAALIELTNPVNFLLGMEIKWAMITITEPTGRSIETKYYQPAINRLRNAFHLNIDGDMPFVKKWKQKRMILNYLFL